MGVRTASTITTSSGDWTPIFVWRLDPDVPRVAESPLVRWDEI